MQNPRGRFVFQDWMRRDRLFADARDLFLIGQNDRAQQQLDNLFFAAQTFGHTTITLETANRHTRWQQDALNDLIRMLYATQTGHTTLQEAVPLIGNLLDEFNHQAGLAYQLAQEERLAHQLGELELQSPPADNFSRDEPDAQ